MKLEYVKPIMQIDSACVCEFLASSYINEIAPERYNYLCPYVPDMRCRDYNRFVRKKKGFLSLPSNVVEYERISVKGEYECPYRNACIKYEEYCKLAGNGRQR